MKNRFFFITAAVMLGLPFAAVKLLPADAGMAACLILFFGIFPLYALLSGWAAGRNLPRHRYQPLVTALLFAIGAALIFTPDEPLFYVYALACLGLGYAAMALSWFLKKSRPPA